MSRTTRPAAAALSSFCSPRPSCPPARSATGKAPPNSRSAAVSERTVRIVLAPLDEKGKPRPGPASTALVELKPDTKLQVRELAEAKEVEVGKLRVRVKPDPLTITVRGPGDKVVQELVIAEADGSVTFRTAAPVLGLGEGGPQFDRRGHLLPPGERPGVAAAVPARDARRHDPQSRSSSAPTAGRCSSTGRSASSTCATGRGGSSRGRTPPGKEPLEVFVVALRRAGRRGRGVLPADGQAGDAAEVGDGLHAVAPHARRAGGAASRSPRRSARRSCRATR